MDDGSRGIEQSAKKQGVADENDLHVSKLSDGVDMVVGRVYALEVRFSDFLKICCASFHFQLHLFIFNFCWHKKRYFSRRSIVHLLENVSPIRPQQYSER